MHLLFRSYEELFISEETVIRVWSKERIVGFDRPIPVVISQLPQGRPLCHIQYPPTGTGTWQLSTNATYVHETKRGLFYNIQQFY